MFSELINIIKYYFSNDIGSTGEILFMLFMTFVMAFYEFIIYRLVSHRTMYNKSFHISIMIIPFFIGSIIMALQSNVIITLGTIGALAIIRFRTAIKDPVDMIYLLWSIFVGITCGCQLFKLCLLTSIVVTLVLLIINLSSGILKNPYILVINCERNVEQQLLEDIKKCSKKVKLKSRNYTSNGVDYIFKIETTSPEKITEGLNNIKEIKQFSLIEYDNEDVI